MSSLNNVRLPFAAQTAEPTQQQANNRAESSLLPNKYDNLPANSLSAACAGNLQVLAQAGHTAEMGPALLDAYAHYTAQGGNHDFKTFAVEVSNNLDAGNNGTVSRNAWTAALNYVKKNDPDTFNNGSGPSGSSPSTPSGTTTGYNPGNFGTSTSGLNLSEGASAQGGAGTFDALFEKWCKDNNVNADGAKFEGAWKQFTGTLTRTYGNPLPTELNAALASAKQTAAKVHNSTSTTPSSTPGATPSATPTSPAVTSTATAIAGKNSGNAKAALQDLEQGYAKYAQECVTQGKTPAWTEFRDQVTKAIGPNAGNGSDVLGDKPPADIANGIDAITTASSWKNASDIKPDDWAKVCKWYGSTSDTAAASTMKETLGKQFSNGGNALQYAADGGKADPNNASSTYQNRLKELQANPGTSATSSVTATATATATATSSAVTSTATAGGNEPDRLKELQANPGTTTVASDSPAIADSYKAIQSHVGDWKAQQQDLEQGYAKYAKECVSKGQTPSWADFSAKVKQQGGNSADLAMLTDKPPADIANGVDAINKSASWKTTGDIEAEDWATVAKWLGSTSDTAAAGTVKDMVESKIPQGGKYLQYAADGGKADPRNAGSTYNNRLNELRNVK